MKLLLTYFLVILVLSARSARRGRPLRTWPLLVASTIVGAAFYNLRVI